MIFTSVPESARAESAKEIRSAPLSIPAAYGTLEAFHQGRNHKTVIYIQDAHDSLEAQINIAEMIRFLVEKQNVTTVLEEGFEGPVPTDQYFGGMTDDGIKEKTAWLLMDRLRIGGAEYAHITRKKDFKLVGADDVRLHLENIEWYRRNADLTAETSKDLAALQQEIGILAAQYFPKKLKEWMKWKKRFDQGELGLLDYVRRLEGLDPVRHPSAALLLSAEKTEDKTILEQAGEIDAITLFSEIADLERGLAEKTLSGETERKIFRFYRGLELLVRLNEIRITPAEFEAVGEEIQSFDTRAMGEFISGNKGQSLVLSRSWEENIRRAVRFYEIAGEREAAIARSLDEFLAASGETSAVLVFGGFHREKITRYLKEKGFSYAVVSPRISEKDPEHEKQYRSLMSEGYKPFEAAPLLARAARYPPIFVEGIIGDPARLERELAKIYTAQTRVPAEETSGESSAADARSEMRTPDEDPDPDEAVDRLSVLLSLLGNELDGNRLKPREIEAKGYKPILRRVYERLDNVRTLLLDAEHVDAKRALVSIMASLPQDGMFDPARDTLQEIIDYLSAPPADEAADTDTPHRSELRSDDEPREVERSRPGSGTVRPGAVIKNASELIKKAAAERDPEARTALFKIAGGKSGGIPAKLDDAGKLVLFFDDRIPKKGITVSLTLKDFARQNVFLRFQKDDSGFLWVRIYRADGDLMLFEAFYDETERKFLSGKEHFKARVLRENVPPMTETVPIVRQEGNSAKNYFAFKHEGKTYNLPRPMDARYKGIAEDEALSVIYVMSRYYYGKEYVLGFLDPDETDPARAFARWEWKRNPQTKKFQFENLHFHVPATMIWFYNLLNRVFEADTLHYVKLELDDKGRALIYKELELRLGDMYKGESEMPSEVVMANSISERGRIDVYESGPLDKERGSWDPRKRRFITAKFYASKQQRFRRAWEEMTQRHNRWIASPTSARPGSVIMRTRKGKESRTGAHPNRVMLTPGSQPVHFQHHLYEDSLILMRFAVVEREGVKHKGLEVYALNEDFEPLNLIKRGYYDAPSKRFLWFSPNKRKPLNPAQTTALKEEIVALGYYPFYEKMHAAHAKQWIGTFLEQIKTEGAKKKPDSGKLFDELNKIFDFLDEAKSFSLRQGWQTPDLDGEYGPLSAVINDLYQMVKLPEEDASDSFPPGSRVLFRERKGRIVDYEFRTGEAYVTILFDDLLQKADPEDRQEMYKLEAVQKELKLIPEDPKPADAPATKAKQGEAEARSELRNKLITLDLDATNEGHRAAIPAAIYFVDLYKKLAAKGVKLIDGEGRLMNSKDQAFSRLKVRPEKQLLEYTPKGYFQAEAVLGYDAFIPDRLLYPDVKLEVPGFTTEELSGRRDFEFVTNASQAWMYTLANAAAEEKNNPLPHPEFFPYFSHPRVLFSLGVRPPQEGKGRVRIDSLYVSDIEVRGIAKLEILRRRSDDSGSYEPLELFLDGESGNAGEILVAEGSDIKTSTVKVRDNVDRFVDQLTAGTMEHLVLRLSFVGRSELRTPGPEAARPAAKSYLQKIFDEMKGVKEAALLLEGEERRKKLAELTGYFRYRNPQVRKGLLTLLSPFKDELQPVMKKMIEEKNEAAGAVEIQAAVMTAAGYLYRRDPEYIRDEISGWFRDWVMNHPEINTAGRRAALKALRYLKGPEAYEIFHAAIREAEMRTDFALVSEAGYTRDPLFIMPLLERVRNLNGGETLEENQIPYPLSYLVNAVWIGDRLSDPDVLTTAYRFGYIDAAVRGRLVQGADTEGLAAVREILKTIGIITAPLLEAYLAEETGEKRSLLHYWRGRISDFLFAFEGERLFDGQRVLGVKTGDLPENRIDQDLLFAALREHEIFTIDEKLEVNPFDRKENESIPGAFFFIGHSQFVSQYRLALEAGQKLFEEASVSPELREIVLPYYAFSALALKTHVQAEARANEETMFLSRWRTAARILTIKRSAAGDPYLTFMPKIGSVLDSEYPNVFPDRVSPDDESEVAALISALMDKRYAKALLYGVLNAEAVGKTNSLIRKASWTDSWNSLSFGAQAALKLYAYDLFASGPSLGFPEVQASWDLKAAELYEDEKILKGKVPSVGIELQTSDVLKDRVYSWKQALEFLGIPSPYRPEYSRIVEAAFPPAWSPKAFLTAIPILVKLGYHESGAGESAFHISLSGDLGDDARYLAFPLLSFRVEKEPAAADEEWFRRHTRVMSKGLINLNRQSRAADLVSESPGVHTEIRTARLQYEDSKDNVLNLSYEIYLPGIQALGAALAAYQKSESRTADEEKLAPIWRSFREELDVLYRTEIYQTAEFLDANWFEGTGDSEDVTVLKELDIMKRRLRLRHYYRDRTDLGRELQKKVRAVFTRYAGAAVAAVRSGLPATGPQKVAGNGGTDFRAELREAEPREFERMKKRMLDTQAVIDTGDWKNLEENFSVNQLASIAIALDAEERQIGTGNAVLIGESEFEKRRESLVALIRKKNLAKMAPPPGGIKSPDVRSEMRDFQDHFTFRLSFLDLQNVLLTAGGRQFTFTGNEEAPVIDESGKAVDKKFAYYLGQLLELVQADSEVILTDGYHQASVRYEEDLIHLNHDSLHGKLEYHLLFDKRELRGRKDVKDVWYMYKEYFFLPAVLNESTRAAGLAAYDKRDFVKSLNSLRDLIRSERSELRNAPGTAAPAAAAGGMRPEAMPHGWQKLQGALRPVYDDAAFDAGISDLERRVVTGYREQYLEMVRNMEEAAPQRSELRARVIKDIRAAVTLETDVVFAISSEAVETLSRAAEGEKGHDQWAELLGLKLLNPEKLHLVILDGGRKTLGARTQELLTGRHFGSVHLGWSPRVPKDAVVIQFTSPAGEPLRAGAANSGIFDGAFLQALRLSFDPDLLKELTANGMKRIDGLVLPGAAELLDSFFQRYVVIARSA